MKIDPGAKNTGFALVNDSTGEVVFAAEIQHRGFAIRDSLISRRQLRRGRRNRKTRYRQPRFENEQVRILDEQLQAMPTASPVLYREQLIEMRDRIVGN